MKCISCGKKAARAVELPHGTIHLCHDIKCSRLLNGKVNEAVPVVWYVPTDLVEKELIDQEILDAFDNHETMIDCGRIMEEALWNDDMMGQLFNESLEIVARELERRFVRENSPEKLIPYIGMMKNDQNNIELEKKLKGG